MQKKTSPKETYEPQEIEKRGHQTSISLWNNEQEVAATMATLNKPIKPKMR